MYLSVRIESVWFIVANATITYTVSLRYLLMCCFGLCLPFGTLVARRMATMATIRTQWFSQWGQTIQIDDKYNNFSGSHRSIASAALCACFIYPRTHRAIFSNIIMHLFLLLLLLGWMPRQFCLSFSFGGKNQRHDTKYPNTKQWQSIRTPGGTNTMTWRKKGRKETKILKKDELFRYKSQPKWKMDFDDFQPPTTTITTARSNTAHKDLKFYWKKHLERERSRSRNMSCQRNVIWLCSQSGGRLVGRSAWIWRWGEMCENARTKQHKTVLKTKNWSAASIHSIFSRLNFHWKIYPAKCQQKKNKIKGNKKQ